MGVCNSLPIYEKVKKSIFFIAVAVIYIVEFKKSTKMANSVWRIIKWLCIAPIIISIVTTCYIMMWWKPIEQNGYFAILLISIFMISWVFAAYKFDLIKVKAAVLILNAILTTALTVVFLTTLDADISKIIFSDDTIQSITEEGFSSNSLIELLVKMLTFPFVVSGIWAQIIIELRSSNIIGQDNIN